MTATNTFNANIKRVQSTTVSSSSTSTSFNPGLNLGKSIFSFGTSYTNIIFTLELKCLMCLSNSTTACGYGTCYLDYMFSSTTSPYLFYVAKRDDTYSGVITNITGSTSGTDPYITVTHSNAWVAGTLITYIDSYQNRCTIS